MMKHEQMGFFFAKVRILVCGRMVRGCVMVSKSIQWFETAFIINAANYIFVRTWLLVIDRGLSGRGQK